MPGRECSVRGLEWVEVGDPAVNPLVYTSPVVSSPDGALWGLCADRDNRSFRLHVFGTTLSVDAQQHVALTSEILPPGFDCPFGPGSHDHYAVSYEGAMFVLGGGSGNPDDGVLRFCFATRKWERVKTSGEALSGMMHKSCVGHEGRVFVFGGHHGLKELHALDLRTMLWERLPDAPKGRRLHSAVVCRDDEGEQCMLVFGGEDEREMDSDSLFKYRFESKQWSFMMSRGSRWPSHRSGHGAVSLNDGDAMLVLAGYGHDDEGYHCVLDDSWLFDMTTMLWSPLLSDPHSHCIPDGAVSPVLVTLENQPPFLLYFAAATQESRPSCRGFVAKLSCPPECDELGCLRDFGQLLRNGLFSDVCFVVSGTKFRAHRNILAVRSEVFARLFQSGMKESAAGVEITLGDCSSSAFAALLTFMYTGSPRHNKAHLCVDEALELLSLADKYFLPVLKKHLERLIGRRLTIGSAAAVLVEAELLGCPELKTKAQDFLLRHWHELSPSTFSASPKPSPWSSCRALCSRGPISWRPDNNTARRGRLEL